MTQLDCFTCSEKSNCKVGMKVDSKRQDGCIAYEGFIPVGEFESMVDPEYQSEEEFHETLD